MKDKFGKKSVDNISIPQHIFISSTQVLNYALMDDLSQRIKKKYPLGEKKNVNISTWTKFMQYFSVRGEPVEPQQFPFNKLRANGC
jgi:hypothetical protein